MRTDYGRGRGFADLIVLPILDIYRRYYGLRMTGLILTAFYVAMAMAALVVETAFGAFTGRETGASLFNDRCVLMAL
jgi:hypothetical protein